MTLVTLVMMDDGDERGDEGEGEDGNDDNVIPSQLQFQSMVLDQLVEKVDIRLNVCFDGDTFNMMRANHCVRCNGNDLTVNLRKTPKQVVVELQDI